MIVGLFEITHLPYFAMTAAIHLDHDGRNSDRSQHGKVRQKLRLVVSLEVMCSP